MKPFQIKTLPLWMFLFFFSTNSLFAQVQHSFSINLGAYVKAKASDFDKVRPIGFIYADRLPNKLLQIYMGDYPDEATANKDLAVVRMNGYPDAFVTRRNLQQGEKAFVLHLDVKTVEETINWQDYIMAGPLFTLLENKNVHIATGAFSNLAEANQRLSIVQKLGFSKAYVQEINNILLHRVSSFEAGGPLSPPKVDLIVEAPAEQAPAEQAPAEQVAPEEATPSETPAEPEVVAEIPAKVIEEPAPEVVTSTIPPPAEMIPDSYDEVLASRGPATKAVVVSLPTIRPKVKRNSAYELQQVLKREGTYTGSLDGYYGKGTKGAFEKAMTTEPGIRKYQLLAQDGERLQTKAVPDPLTATIAEIGSNPGAALQRLEYSKAPLAKAYQAYYLFNKRGAQQGVNDMMNTAIQTAITTDESLPFDQGTTYSYKNTAQVLEHLAHLHQEVDVPCWLFERHPKAAPAAFDKAGVYQLADCDQFSKWEPLQLLEVVAQDLSPNPAPDPTIIDHLATIRSRYFVAPPAITTDQRKAMEEWHNSLWTGIDAWATEDLLHEKMTTPLRLTYFQSMVLLEDHFMDKKIAPLEAKGLALSVLQTIVAPYLESYRR